MKQPKTLPTHDTSQSPTETALGLRALEPHELKLVSGGDAEPGLCRPGVPMDRQPGCKGPLRD
jgi:hypothetical protein